MKGDGTDKREGNGQLGWFTRLGINRVREKKEKGKKRRKKKGRRESWSRKREKVREGGAD